MSLRTNPIAPIFGDIHKKIAHNNIKYDDVIGRNAIKITPNLKVWAGANRIHSSVKTYMESNPILGLLKDEFTLGVYSHWETTEFPKILDTSLLQSASVIAGGGAIGEVFRSKKLWKNSGDISISPSIRIVDVLGNGAPQKAVFNCLLYVTSSVVGDIISKETVQKITTAIGGVGNFMEKAINVTTDVIPLVDLKSLGSAVAGLTGDMSKEYIRDLDDYSKLRASPPPLIVEIGQVFKYEDMVCTNVEFTFSKECSVAGPLWVDIKLSLQSRTIISDITKVGLMWKPKEDFVVEIGRWGNTGDTNVSIKEYTPPTYSEKVKTQPKTFNYLTGKLG